MTTLPLATCQGSLLHPKGFGARRAVRAARPSRCLRLAVRPIFAVATPVSPTDEQASKRLPSEDDVVIVGACRTANTRAKKGGFKDTPVDELIAAVLKDTLRRTNGAVKGEEIGDICFGSVMEHSGKRASETRIAEILAGYPISVPVYNVDRQCAAGLQAIADVAASIKAGYYDIGIAGGVESMTGIDTTGGLELGGSSNPHVHDVQDAEDCLLPMGMTAENVAERYNVPREVQDKMAAASHAKAAAAQAAGKFNEEIVPLETVWKNPATGEEEHLVVDHDDSIHPDFTFQKLSKLKPVFRKGGSVTVGNACGVTDGAAAVLMMKRKEAERRGLPIMASLRSFAVVGVPPAIMGIGPAVAIPKALDKAGLTKEDIGIFEINEAFAAQAAYCVRELGIDEEKVNPNGSGIALGHPIGCTGVRQTVTLLHEMARRGEDARYGVVSMCCGTGMGAAAVFEHEGGNGKAQ